MLWQCIRIIGGCVYPFWNSYVNEGGWTGTTWMAVAPILHMHVCIAYSLLTHSLRAIWLFRFVPFFFVRCTPPFQLLRTRQILSASYILLLEQFQMQPFSLFLCCPLVGSFVVILCESMWNWSACQPSNTKEISENDDGDDDDYCFGTHIARTHANQLPSAVHSLLH